MGTSKAIHVVGCHAEGEVGDVIVGGVALPPGDTIWEQRCFLEQDRFYFAARLSLKHSNHARFIVARANLTMAV